MTGRSRLTSRRNVIHGRYNANFPTGDRGLIAVDKAGNQVLFLDPATLRTQDVINGFAPRVHELAISPDRATAYAPIYGDGRHGANPHPGQAIAVIDLATRQHVGDLSVAPFLAPHGLRWGPRGELYRVCEDSGVVLELDPTTGQHRNVIDVGSTNAHRIEVLPDGSCGITRGFRLASVPRIHRVVPDHRQHGDSRPARRG